ncbi:MAG: AEC family transporter [Mycoplasmatales bacterium]
MITISLSTMISLAALIIVGYSLEKKNILDEHTINKFSNFLLTITFPAMLIGAFNVDLSTSKIIDPTIPSNIYMPIILGFLVYILLFMVCILTIKPLKVKKEHKDIILFSLLFGNTSFIGFPLISSVLGQDALIYMVLLNIPFNIIVFSLGTYILADDKKHYVDFKNILLTPVMFGMYIGLSLMMLNIFFNVSIPSFIESPINMLGDMTPPLSMIIVGCSLTKANIPKAIKTPVFYYISLLKLLIIPIITYLIFSIFMNNNVLLLELIIFTGVPTATISVVFARSYKLDHVYASEIILITTILSLLSIPFLFYLFGFLA